MAVLLGFVVGFIAFFIGVLPNLYFIPLIGLVAGLGISITDMIGAKISLSQTGSTRRQLLLRTFTTGLIVALLVGLTVGLFYRLVPGATSALIFGFFYGVFFGLRGNWQTFINDVQTVEILRWTSWAKVAKGGLGGLVAGLIIALIAGLTTLLFSEVITETSFDGNYLIYWNNEIMTAQIEIDPTPDSYSSYLNISTETPSDFFGGLIIALMFFLGFGGLIGVLYSAVTGGVVEAKDTANQGVRLSIRNALRMGLLWGALPMFGVVGISYVLAQGWLLFEFEILPVWLVILIASLITGLVFGLPAALWYGGLEVIKHYTLRLILWRTGQLPWNIANFLDHATDLIFLRKVGGGYIFIHRLMMEYFASLTEEDIDRLAIEIETGRT